MTRDEIAALKRAHPLAEVVAADGVRLTPVGRALVGLCPFHADGGHPNLHVYPQADPAGDHYHCYSCSAHGDALDFLIKRHGVSFREACARLGAAPRPARPAGRRPPAPGPERHPEGLTLAEGLVMDAAAAVYQRRLWETPRALGYLRARGLPEWLVRACGLGYADGHALGAFLRRRGWLRIGERLGLLRRVEPEGGARPLRELLAGRIVVPEIRGGHAVWFIGRRLPTGRDDGNDPLKYLALPGERPLLGLERVLGQREPFLVEGVFGYLTALSWGLPACSPCGTHLPPERLEPLAEAERVWGLLDPDDAGREAAARLGTQLGPRWWPLWLPDGAEIDDLAARPRGREELFSCLAAARAAQDAPKENDLAR